MELTIQLSEATGEILRERAKTAGVSAEDFALQLLMQDLVVTGASLCSATPLRSVSEEILRRVRALPDEAFEGLPTDGASQHDHYIYGTPKREDL